jgi:2-iminobutanoate/2-iminopropanoate deaminase
MRSFTAFPTVVLAAIVTAGCAMPGHHSMKGHHGSAGPRSEVVSTKDAPEAIGPYSQAIKYGPFVFLAGQIPIDPKTNKLLNEGSIEDQTRLVLENLKAVLTASGMTMENIVSTSVFLKDMNEFPRMNAVYGTYFKTAPPARATVEVARLPRDVKVEISAIAAR